jgi:hypothetical protein
MRNFRPASRFVVCGMSLLSTGHACPSSVMTPFQAIALYNRQLLDRLENKNNISEICSARDLDCSKSALAPVANHLDVYSRPDGSVIASLIIVYTPGEGLSAQLTSNKEVYRFTPIIHDTDSGYGFWFHATLLVSEGVWHKIVLPEIGRGWIKVPDPEILSLAEEGKIYSIRKRNVAVLKHDMSAIVIRDEQPADMWCNEGQPPSLEPYAERTLRLEELYDSNCELLIRPAYTRGC